jgi:hypothetical protein
MDVDVKVGGDGGEVEASEVYLQVAELLIDAIEISQ